MIANSSIQEILNKREAAFQDLYQLDSYDDEQLERIERFKEKYKKLKQWEQDLYFVFLQEGTSTAAEMYGICYSTCFKKIQKIKNKLK